MNVEKEVSPEKYRSLLDAEYLKTLARDLSYNGPDAVKKHKLFEIAMRIETGFYNER